MSSEGSGEQEIFHAIWRGDPDWVRSVLKNGGSANARRPHGATALTEAAGTGNLEVVSILLAHGAELESADELGRTALHVAAMGFNSAPLVDLLLTRGANPEARDKSGKTPLEVVVAYGGNSEAADMLRLRSRDPGKRAANLDLALWTAVRDSDIARMPILLSSGADPNAAQPDKRTPLHLAATIGNVGAGQILIASGARVDPVTTTNETPLHTACWYGRTDFAVLLLENGADVHVRNKSGQTPLHVAVISPQYSDRPRRLALVEYLLAAGADPATVGKNGISLRLEARARGHEEIAMLFPAGASEPPEDPGARGIASMELARHGSKLLMYHPNNLAEPFAVLENDGRDWWGFNCSATLLLERFDAELGGMGCEWVRPFIERLHKKEFVGFAEFEAAFRKNRHGAPEIKRFPA